MSATSCMMLTVATLPNWLQLHPIQTVPACSVQIRAHHHIDVYTDINQTLNCKISSDHQIQTLKSVGHWRPGWTSEPRRCHWSHMATEACEAVGRPT